ncbi:MAG: tRNA (adenosine(37)-N6)-threonylcarbamoyltransferase complex dimerization subunit type 1 TsaB [Acidimicrobiia bacterium]|nr:tRNA (adenosine(37)-N6)-threonylcarbamoyltransferase complex dimerization subunit type 1 TsaB [Acidimicrobiia bacterium]
MKLRVLAIDTSGEVCSLALLTPEGLYEQRHRSAEGHAHLLFPQVEALLREAGLGVADIDCFAAASGPGSFTGVRVALSAVKGLAEATGKAAAGVSNLQALAWHGSAKLRAPLIDARRQEVYGAVYDGELRLVQPETVGPVEAWLASLPEGEVEIVTADSLPLPAGHPRVCRVSRELARAVAHIAAGRLLAGLAAEAAALEANYVRRSDAELSWKEVG